MIGAPPPTRQVIERAIDALIDLLDAIDGDPDAEPEEDFGPDDRGERDGDTFMGAA